MRSVVRDRRTCSSVKISFDTAQCWCTISTRKEVMSMAKKRKAAKKGAKKSKKAAKKGTKKAAKKRKKKA